MEQHVEMMDGSELGYTGSLSKPQPFSGYDQTGRLNTMSDQLTELEYLGLVKQVSNYPTGIAFSSDGMITGHALTNFAEDFIEFIEEEDVAELSGNSLIQRDASVNG